MRVAITIEAACSSSVFAESSLISRLMSTSMPSTRIGAGRAIGRRLEAEEFSDLAPGLFERRRERGVEVDVHAPVAGGVGVGDVRGQHLLSQGCARHRPFQRDHAGVEKLHRGSFPL